MLYSPNPPILKNLNLGFVYHIRETTMIIAFPIPIRYRNLTKYFIIPSITKYF